MSDYPGAIDYPAHPTNVLGPPANRPKGWCLHTPEEPADGYAGTPVWFARPNIGGSTTYFVSYLGFVFQCVPENVGAIANGVTADREYPTWANENVSLNRQTLSVEIEGYAATIANTISPAQKTALLNLLAYGCEKYGIPKDRAHIIGHYQVASNRTDPGTLDIDALVAELQTPIEEDDMPDWFKETDWKALQQKVSDVYALRFLADTPPMTIRKQADGKVWLIVWHEDAEGVTPTKHHVQSPATLKLLTSSWNQPLPETTPAEVAGITEGDPIP